MREILGVFYRIKERRKMKFSTPRKNKKNKKIKENEKKRNRKKV